MYIDHKKVFIAGATGMVGSSIIKYILEHYPATTICASYHKTEPFIQHDRIEYVRGNLISLEDCRTMVKGCHCAIMAATNTASAGTINVDPAQFINENLIMNMQMFKAFHAENVQRVVYIGSATLYQDYEDAIKEDELDLNKEPHSAYFGFGWVVRYTEKLCSFWHKHSGMEIVIARASNVFGPYAKFDPATSNFIPAIIRKTVDKMDPFEVWGEPDVTRDVIYSEDFAKAIVMLMDNDKIKHDVFNIGSGIRTTVGDVVRLALKCANHKPKELKYVAHQPRTFKFRALDCSKAKEVLGWQPQYTIEEGVKQTVRWWLENKGWWKK